jgi:hypothetical protein
MAGLRQRVLACRCRGTDRRGARPGGARCRRASIAVQQRPCHGRMDAPQPPRWQSRSAPARGLRGTPLRAAEWAKPLKLRETGALPVGFRPAAGAGRRRVGACGSACCRRPGWCLCTERWGIRHRWLDSEPSRTGSAGFQPASRAGGSRPPARDPPRWGRASAHAAPPGGRLRLCPCASPGDADAALSRDGAEPAGKPALPVSRASARRLGFRSRFQVGRMH